MENTQQNAEQFLIELEKSQNAPLFDKRFWAEALYNYANKLNKPCVSSSISIQEIGEIIEDECEEHIATNGLRFYGISWAQITRILQKYGFKSKIPF